MSAVVLKGHGTYISFAGDYNGGSGSNYYASTIRRGITYVSPTQYSMSDCYIRWGNSTAQHINNNQLVPMVIYGGNF